MAESLKIETIIEEPVIKKRAVKNAPWRHNADGTYNKNPSDPEYFKKILERKFKKIVCMHSL